MGARDLFSLQLQQEAQALKLMLRTCRVICISDEAHKPGFISSTQEGLSQSLTEGDIT